MRNAIKEFALPKVCVVLLMVFLSILIPSLSPLRWIAGTCLVLILPGYAWLAAAGIASALSGVWLVVLSIGVSISLDVICGLLLNFTSWGLATDSWLIALGIIALVGSIIETMRLVRLPPGQRPTAPSLRLVTEAAQASVRHKLLAVAAIIILVAAGVVANVSASIPDRANEVVQFWMIPASPKSVSAPERVTIGIHAVGGSASSHYQVVVRADGNVIETTGPITMQPGSTWQSAVGLRLPPNTLVEADLYRMDEPDQIFRSVWVWTPAHS